MTEQNDNMLTDIPRTHFLIFKDRKYPINMDIFKVFSNHFKDFHGNINEEISLLDKSEDNLPITEEDVQTFVNYCQNHRLDENCITLENAITLKFLAEKYKVPTLLNRLGGFISKNHEKLRAQYISMYPNAPESVEDEKIIAENFKSYTNDPFLKLLPVSTLHRIMTNVDIDNEVLDFLFEYLDIIGRNASILFQNVDFAHKETKYLTIIMGYSDDQFDFHFINKNAIRDLYAIQESILAIEEDIKLKQDESKKDADNKIELIKSMKNDLENDMEEVRQMKDGLIQQMKMSLIE